MQDSGEKGLGIFGKLILVFLLLYLLAGFGYGIYVGFVVSLLVLIIFISSIIKRDMLLRRDLGWIILSLFSIIYAFKIYQFDFSSPVLALSTAVFPPAFYLAGRYIFMRTKQINHKYLILVAVAGVMAIFALVCVVYTLKTLGIIEAANSQRSVTEVWSGMSLNATNIGGYIALGIGMFGIIFVRATNRFEVWIKLILLAVSAVCIYVEFELVNRTDLIIFVAAIVAVSLVSTRNQERNRKTLISIFAILVFASVALGLNAFKVNDAWKNTQLYHRFATNTITSDGRFSAWRDSFLGVFENPGGGRVTILSLNYAHNLWLDVGYDAGLAPFALLMIFVVLVIKDYLILIFKNDLPILFRSIIVVLLIGFLFTFMVEPVMVGILPLFVAFCFVSGAVSMYSRERITLIDQNE